MPSVHLLVTGRVQGVGFRWFVRERARALGLRGWVRNLDDGGVEVVAEGPASELDALVRALERGPLGAQVEDVATRPSPGRPEHSDYPDPFAILR